MRKHVTTKTLGRMRVDQFRAGDVWKSPRGERHVVTRVSAGGVAYMINENTQCTALRASNDLGWGADSPWVLVFSGTERNS